MSQTTAPTIDVKHLSSGPVFGLKGAIYLDPSGTFACIERAKAGTFAREFTETIQNDPHLQRFLSSLMVVLLKIGGKCSGLRAKPAHFSGHLPIKKSMKLLKYTRSQKTYFIVECRCMVCSNIHEPGEKHVVRGGCSRYG